MSYKILLADSQPIIHQGVRSAFAQESKFEIVSATTKSEQIFVEAQRHQPNLLITEARIDGKDALKTLEQVMSNQKGIVVVVFSSNLESSNIARAATLGCYEYVSKNLPCEALVKAAKNGINGSPRMPGSLLQRAQMRLKDTRLPIRDQTVLTAREMQVIRHVALGLKNREIGVSLGISVETVKEHVQNILRKLQVNDRTQAAVKAHKRGWV